MKIVQLEHASGRCPVYIGSGLIESVPLWDRHLSGRVLIVTDRRVGPYYLERLQSVLGDKGKSSVVVEGEEENKSLEAWYTILDKLVSIRAGRDATVIALGGGLVGDMAGFAAACYMRGIRVIQVPTTLLAQVDAAIGGKTGINHRAGKNLIGAFHQPEAVIADLGTLDSLPEREFRAGLAEVVKYGALGDEDFFNWLESQSDALNSRLPETLREAIYRSVSNKVRIVSADEREGGHRALLNFGHSFGHALEAAGRYTRFLHGEAVSIGMVLAARLSEIIGLAPGDTASRLAKLLERLGLPIEMPGDMDPEQILGFMKLDKKNRADQLTLILLEKLGKARIVTNCPVDDVREVFRK